MQAKDIVQKLIDQIRFKLTWHKHSSMFADKQPGSMIMDLPEKERQEIKNFQAKDLNPRLDSLEFQYLFENYYDNKERHQKLFENFDKKLKK